MTPDAVAEQLRLFVAVDQVVELRALHVGQKGRTYAGWFDGAHLVDLAKQALMLAREAAGVYFTPNPVAPELLERSPNRITQARRDAPPLTKDPDVPERRFLLVDIDPARAFDADPAGPSSAREVGFARFVARQVAGYMAGFGFAAPVQMLSGNGIHLVYRLAAPAPGGRCDPSDPLARLLRVLADRFGCYGAAVDTNTYTPARMLKVPGTLVRKGEATRTRPHRVARILTVPHDWQHPGPVGRVPERPPEPAPAALASKPERKRAARPAAPQRLFDSPDRVDPH